MGGDRNFPFLASFLFITWPFILYGVVIQFGEFEFNPKTFDCSLILFDSRWVPAGWDALSSAFTLSFVVWVFLGIQSYSASHPEEMIRTACSSLTSSNEADRFLVDRRLSHSHPGSPGRVN